MTAGVMLMVHTDWGAPESYGIRHGVWRCVDELSAKTTLTAEESSDLWVLKNMVHHVSLSLDHVVRSTLPQQISMVEHRWDRLRAQLSA